MRSRAAWLWLNITPRPARNRNSFRIRSQVSHDRVTDETAEVRLLAPDHPALNRPNKITAQDFAGWVQERGLYFPDQWDAGWTPLLSSNDPGEPPRDSGLLVTQVGQGWFVYTGYSFFRELPAGRARGLPAFREPDLVRPFREMSGA